MLILETNRREQVSSIFGGIGEKQSLRMSSLLRLGAAFIWERVLQSRPQRTRRRRAACKPPRSMTRGSPNRISPPPPPPAASRGAVATQPQPAPRSAQKIVYSK